MFNKSDFKFLGGDNEEKYFLLFTYISIKAKNIISGYSDPYWELDIYEDFPYLTGVDSNYDNIRIIHALATQFDNFNNNTKKKFIEAVLTAEFNGKYLKIVEPYRA